MEYDYNEFTLKKLKETYDENEKRILILEKNMAKKERRGQIITALSFFSTLILSVIGLSTFELDRNVFLLIAIILMWLQWYYLENTEIKHNEKEEKNFLLKENEKISLIYKIKTNTEII